MLHSGCQNKKLYPNIDGAPNFRQVHMHISAHCFIVNLHIKIGNVVGCEEDSIEGMELKYLICGPSDASI